MAGRRFLWILAATVGTGLAATAGCAGDPGSVTDTVSGRAIGTDVGGPSERLVSAVDRRTPGDPEQAGSAMAGFGADLLRAVHGASPNTVLSPYSLYTVLAMARAGAKAETARQLDVVLGLDGPDAQGGAITAIDAGIAAALAAAERVRQPISVTASNEAWIANGIAVRQEYLDLLARQFAVSAVAADFAGQPEPTRRAMNDWVSKRTNELIPELFPVGSIDPSTLLVLVNALYLKAPWRVPFGPPSDRAFTTGAGASVQVSMISTMTQGVAEEVDGWTAATVAYAGSGLQMTLLVPDAGRFDDVLLQLDAHLMAAAAQATGGVLLTMPSFDISSTPEVQDAIAAFGVVDLFSAAAADLSGIYGEPGQLFATALVHKATITVDQYGTEAAAATGMAMAGSAPPPPPMKLTIDRPFFFWISGQGTGAPLFLGTVTDPR